MDTYTLTYTTTRHRVAAAAQVGALTRTINSTPGPLPHVGYASLTLPDDEGRITVTIGFDALTADDAVTAARDAIAVAIPNERALVRLDRRTGSSVATLIGGQWLRSA